MPIGFEGIEGGAHGYFHLLDNRIAIQEGMSQLQTIKTAIHEIAHAKLHTIDPNTPEQSNRPDSRTREVQAESVAYAVCSTTGWTPPTIPLLCGRLEFRQGLERAESLP